MISIPLCSSPDYVSISKLQQQVKEHVLTGDMAVIREYSAILELKIQMEKERLMNDGASCGKGRGGNNIAENIKKSIISLLRKTLSPPLFARFQQECIDRYKLKSQKENILVFFLYLHKLHSERLIQYSVVENLREALGKRIAKYIKNSQDKLPLQAERCDFHRRNIEEFKKFAEIDLDFRQKRSFASLTEPVRRFYIRKTTEFIKAVDRLKMVIESDPLFMQLVDVSGAMVKEEQISETESSKRDAESWKQEAMMQ